MRIRNGIDRGLNFALSVRFGSSQCSQNISGRISGERSCMFPAASGVGRVQTVQVRTHCFGSSSGGSGLAHNSSRLAVAMTSPSP
ncbi:MAG: hypothetical protein K0Q46_2743 [Rhodococcus erythropolis]|nr:hypothetical protein [Rhodococcus erythropolis]